MGSNHSIAGNSHTERTAQGKSLQIDEPELENELENRIKNLDRLVHCVHAAPHQVSFSGKVGSLDLRNDLCVKVKATHDMFRVAKLLSEPARESMLSRVRDSLNVLEEVTAYRLDVEIT
jgi:hypothetical protein